MKELRPNQIVVCLNGQAKMCAYRVFSTDGYQNMRGDGFVHCRTLKGDHPRLWRRKELRPLTPVEIAKYKCGWKFSEEDRDKIYWERYSW